MKCNTSFKIVSEWKTIKKEHDNVRRGPSSSSPGKAQPFSRPSFPQLRTPREPRLPPALHLRLDSDASASAAPAYRSPLAMSAPAPSRVLVLQHGAAALLHFTHKRVWAGKGSDSLSPLLRPVGSTEPVPSPQSDGWRRGRSGAQDGLKQNIKA